MLSNVSGTTVFAASENVVTTSDSDALNTVLRFELIILASPVAWKARTVSPQHGWTTTTLLSN